MICVSRSATDASSATRSSASRSPAFRARGGQLVLQCREKLHIYKLGQRFSGYAFGVFCPCAPAQMIRERGFIFVFQQLKLILPVIEYLQKEHPDKLTDALGIAVNADILAHDILNGFNDAGNIAHADLS